MIPVLNLVILPVALRRDAMWVDCYRDKHAMWK
jgi:CysZ protein